MMKPTSTRSLVKSVAACATLAAVSVSVSGMLFGCEEAKSETNLSSDYVLASPDPAVANVTNILLRYEDDWLPGSCIGVTRHLDGGIVRIEWVCRYYTNAGIATDAPIEGSLSDPDGDGTFEGTLVVVPLPDINSRTLGAPVAVTYTLTPYVEPADGI